MSKIYVGDVGTVIRLNVDPDELGTIDISTASTLKILVQKPDKTEVEWTATQYQDTTKIEYSTVDGDLDQKGTYKIQAYVAWHLPASEHKGETTTIRVYEGFK
jgi:hypothetical protein